MRDYTLHDMAKFIQDNLDTENAFSRIKDTLQAYWKDKIAIVWGVEDALLAANDVGRVLSDKEAMKVLRECLENHDVDKGFTWRYLQETIKASRLGRKATKAEQEKIDRCELVEKNAAARHR